MSKWGSFLQMWCDLGSCVYADFLTEDLVKDPEIPQEIYELGKKHITVRLPDIGKTVNNIRDVDGRPTDVIVRVITTLGKTYVSISDPSAVIDGVSIISGNGLQEKPKEVDVRLHQITLADGNIVVRKLN